MGGHICDTKDQAGAGHMQSKCPPSCTITRALHAFFFFPLQSASSLVSVTWQIYFHSGTSASWTLLHRPILVSESSQTDPAQPREADTAPVPSTSHVFTVLYHAIELYAQASEMGMTTDQRGPVIRMQYMLKHWCDSHAGC